MTIEVMCGRRWVERREGIAGRVDECERLWSPSCCGSVVVEEDPTRTPSVCSPLCWFQQPLNRLDSSSSLRALPVPLSIRLPGTVQLPLTSLSILCVSFSYCSPLHFARVIALSPALPLLSFTMADTQHHLPGGGALEQRFKEMKVAVEGEVCQ